MAHPLTCISAERGAAVQHTTSSGDIGRSAIRAAAVGEALAMLRILAG